MEHRQHTWSAAPSVSWCVSASSVRNDVPVRTEVSYNTRAYTKYKLTDTRKVDWLTGQNLFACKNLCHSFSVSMCQYVYNKILLTIVSPCLSITHIKIIGAGTTICIQVHVNTIQFAIICHSNLQQILSVSMPQYQGYVLVIQGHERNGTSVNDKRANQVPSTTGQMVQIVFNHFAGLQLPCSGIRKKICKQLFTIT